MLQVMQPTLYSIEVTEDIATKIRVMAEANVFSMKGGSCEIHFDAQGTIALIVTHTQQRFPKLSTDILASES